MKKLFVGSIFDTFVFNLGLLAFYLTILTISLSSTAFSQEDDAPQEEQLQEIQNLVSKLADDSFEIRQQASDELFQAGRLAEPILERALVNPDSLEAKIRIEKILESFRLGIYADTPPEVAKEIKQFRKYAVAEQKRLLETRIRENDMISCMRLIETVEDLVRRKSLANLIYTRVRKQTLTLIAAGNMEVAEEMLYWSSAYDFDQSANRDLAVFLKTKNGLAEAIRQTEEKDLINKPVLMANLLTFSGDFERAKQEANSLDASPLTLRMRDDLDFRTQNWKSLLRRASKYLTEYSLYCRLAIYHRLNGNTFLSQRAMNEIVDLTADDQEQVVRSAGILIANGEFDRAIAILKNHNLPAAIDLEFNRMDYKAALLLIGLEDPKKAAQWFQEQLELPIVDKRRRLHKIREIFVITERLTVMLARAGETAIARDLLNTLLANPHSESQQLSLIKTALKSGFDDFAMARGNDWLKRYPRDNQMDFKRRKDLIQAIFPKVAGYAQSAMNALVRERTKANNPNFAGILQEVSRFVKPDKDNLPSDVELDRLVAKFRKHLIVYNSPKRQRAIVTGNIGWLYMQHGKFEKAIDHYLVAITNSRQPMFFLALGRCYREIGDLRRAASYYGQAGEEVSAADRPATVAVAMYLQGAARVEAGLAVEESKQQMANAELLPLANPAIRYQFAAAIASHGFRPIGDRNILLGTEVGINNPRNTWMYKLNKVASDLLAETDPERTQTLHKRRLLRFTIAGNFRAPLIKNFSETHAGYLSQAKSLAANAITQEDAKVKKERIITAKIAFKKCIEMWKMNARARISYVTFLREINDDEEADRILEQGIRLQQDVLEMFANDHRSHNALATLAACGDRYPKRAVTHALRAVELKPDNANYLETLSIAYTSRGQKEEAIEATNRAKALRTKDSGHDRLPASEQTDSYPSK